MSNRKIVNVIGYASGVASADPGTAQGPLVLQQSSFLSALKADGVDLHWQQVIKPLENSSLSKAEIVAKACHELAVQTALQVKNQHFFAVFGGDHSSAIGTWSGVASAASGAIGLIWIDAHMDSHTDETSPTGNIHGMPVACLLGHGASAFTHLLSDAVKLQPKHFCLIGIRSFEPGEAALLKKLNVKIFYMDEVQQRGVAAVLADAIKIVTNGTVGYGVSVDIDSIDPEEAPGTGVAEPQGIHADELCDALRVVAADDRLMGIEVVEFDPYRDKNQQTEKIIPKLVKAMTVGK